MEKEDLKSECEKKQGGKRLKWWHLPLLLFLVVGTVYIVRSNDGGVAEDSRRMGKLGNLWGEEKIQKCEGTIFGTIYHITYCYSENLQDSVLMVLHGVDNSLSPFNDKSVITSVNMNKDMKVDDNFKLVFTLAKFISQETSGAFDITVAPLVNAWGFGFKNMSNVSDAQIDSLRNFVGFDKVNLDGDIVVKQDSSIMLDCSAIAKGYGVDAVGRYFESKGIKNYMVEIGGEVRVRGCNPSGDYWKIGIIKPEDDSLCLQNDVEQVLKLTDISLATSGNYRNFYEKGNKRYAHTIDPRTGYPVQHTILSSTVIATDCAVADAYATAFMVLGVDEAKKVLDNHKEINAFFIYSVEGDKTAEWMSPALKSSVVE